MKDFKKDFKAVLQEYKSIYKNNKTKTNTWMFILMALLIISGIALAIFGIASIFCGTTKTAYLGTFISCGAILVLTFIIYFVDKRNWQGKVAHREELEEKRVQQFSEWLKENEYDSKEKIEYLICIADKQYKKNGSSPYLSTISIAAIPILINLFTSEDKWKHTALAVSLGIIIACIILGIADCVSNKRWITEQMQDDLVYIKTYYR